MPFPKDESNKLARPSALYNCNLQYAFAQVSRSTVSSNVDQVAYIDTLDYFEQLLEEKRRVETLGDVTASLNLLDLEIERVRQSLAQCTFTTGVQNSQETENGRITLTEKIWVPTERFPEYNFAGRILGPRGMTVKRVEQETGCRIYVRGKGSMKHAKGEDGLEEELNVVITVEDEPSGAKAKMASAKAAIEKLLTPGERGMDDLKRKQLMELAIINGNYRPSRNNPPTPSPKRIEAPNGIPQHMPTVGYLPLGGHGGNIPLGNLHPLANLSQVGQMVPTSMPMGFRQPMGNGGAMVYSLLPATYVQ